MAWPTPILTPMLLAGCSDIQTSTWEVELSADPTPHLVELWRETEDSKPTRVFAYSVEFPQINRFRRGSNPQRSEQPLLWQSPLWTRKYPQAIVRQL